MKYFPKAACVGGALVLFAHSAEAQGLCIQIDTIDVSGVTLVSGAEVDVAIAPYQGACLDIEGINGALEAVTFLYVDQGYVTARAYLPEQNIADRSLDITVVEGELSAVRFNGEAQPIWEAIVFPNLSGKSANLREIEQGLEIIRGMPAYNATMEISAGDAEGQSILDVSATADRPWTARVGADNRGTKGSGEFNGTIDLTYDHLLGLNESWSLRLARGTEKYPFSPDTGGAATQSINGSVRFPYGPWALRGNYSYAGYETDTLGPITTIGTDGWTHTADIGLSRVVHRNQNSKTTLSGTVEYRKNVNRIADIQINASSRTLASARIDLAHERSVLGGSLSARLGYEEGLNVFGAEKAPDPLVGPNAQFRLGDFELNYFRPWETEIGAIAYSGTLRGQWSDDVLYGNYQFALGGLSSVRGVKTSQLDGIDGGVFSGGTGALWRNDVSWTPQIDIPDDFGRLQVYGGLDAGIVDLSSRDFSPALIGSAIGLRAVGGAYSADVAWHQLVYGPRGVELPGGIFVASFSARF